VLELDHVDPATLTAMAAGVPCTATKAWVCWGWVGDHRDDIAAAVRQHVELTVVAVAIGLLISAPLSYVAWRRRRAAAVILSGTGILYTFPSLALFGFLIPFTGLTFMTAEIALVSYTLLVIIRNTLAGLDGVPAEVREAARGMGLTPMQQLLKVELPLAVPTIMAGIRNATVGTIGLVTVTALITYGGVGNLILLGLRKDFRTPLVVGSVLSLLLAVAADLLLLGLQRLLTPWTRGAAAR
jgi:osmoprotectant transport system permease protein